MSPSTPFNFENLLTAGLFLGVIGLIVVVTQIFYYKGLVIGEYSRKMSHILIALWMSSWRFLGLSQLEVTYICIALLFILIVIKQFGLFNAIFSVQRATLGEFMFILGVIMTVLIFSNETVYALAIINLGIADGMAAIIGNRFGKKKYNVFGSTKSIIGLLTSFTVVLLTGAVFWMFANIPHLSTTFIAYHLISTAATIAGLEFVSSKGIDNLTIPVFTGLLYHNLII